MLTDQDDCMSFRRTCSVLALVASLGAAAGPEASAATGTSGTSGAAWTAGAAGAAWRTVAYDGVTLKVPASWPVVRLSRQPRACPRLNVHAVYLGTPGPDSSCPADLQGKTTAVTIQRVNAAGPDLRQATRRTEIGGRAARTNTDAAVTHAMIDILPSAGVEVSLSYGRSLRLARSIQATIRITRRAGAVRHATTPATTTPATIKPAAIKPAAPQGLVQGRGFDTCAAPSAATMKDWRASPYRAIGVYIGGVNRACAQSNLTSAWLTKIQSEGWHYFPFYVGLQASCVAALQDSTIKPASAATQGTAAADDAVTQASDLGIPASTPIIYDMEAYRGGCGSEVTAFLSAWDSELHARGYVAGVYESFSNIGDLISAAGQMIEPDVIHYADWDGHATTNSSYMPSGMWISHQRIHQYRGGHGETYGGATINIDNDQLDVTLSGTPAGGARRPGFRMAAALNSNGSAEWFARAANGTLRHNYQYPVGSATWSATRTVGYSPGDLVGNPAVAANADGSLTLFAQTTRGKVVHAWQQAGAPNDWNWGGVVGGGKPPRALATGSGAVGPAAIRVSDGEVAVFAASSGGAVVTTRQDSPSDNTGWTAWAAIGGDCASSPVPFTGSSKMLEVLCRTANGSLAVDVSGRGGWQGWQTVAGGPAALTGTPAVVSGGGGQTEVLARAASGKLAYAWQGATGSWTWGSSPAGSALIKNSPAAVAWPGGGVGVVAQQANGQLGYAVQQGGGSAGWGGWTAMSAHLLGSPAVWANTNGDPEVAILNKQLDVAVSTYSAGGWSSWTKLGGGY
jgi:hypothetical protein